MFLVLDTDTHCWKNIHCKESHVGMLQGRGSRNFPTPTSFGLRHRCPYLNFAKLFLRCSYLRIQYHTHCSTKFWFHVEFSSWKSLFFKLSHLKFSTPRCRNTSESDPAISIVPQILAQLCQWHHKVWLWDVHGIFVTPLSWFSCVADI